MYSIRNASSAEEDRACGLRGSLHYEECHLCSTRREKVMQCEERVYSTRIATSDVGGQGV